MIAKSIDQITEKDLQDLIDNQVLECKTIEYKQALPGNSDFDKKEFLADVSSFANASGGDLIYGIIEDRETGTPKILEGLAIENVDQEISRLYNIIGDGIQPRILGITIQDVKLSNSKVALIIRVSKSWVSPHRVIFGGHDKFYSRSANRKSPMDVGELRSAFNLSETITERIRNFRVDRISKILANETPVPLNDTAKIVLHLIPVISFNPAQRYEINKMADSPHRGKMNPIGPGSSGSRYNFDGFLSYSVQHEGKPDSYFQLFYNGIIEAVDGHLLDPSHKEGELCIPSTSYEEDLINSVSNYISLLKELNVDLPIFIFLSLLGVKGYSMAVRSGIFVHQPHVIDRDVLLVPEVVIEKYDVETAVVLMPCFDSVWNACGFRQSLNYNEAGKWKAR